MNEFEKLILKVAKQNPTKAMEYITQHSLSAPEIYLKQICDLIGIDNTINGMRIITFFLLYFNLTNELHDYKLYKNTLKDNYYDLIKFMLRMNTYQSMDVIYIIDLIGNRSEDKISLYHDEKYKPKVQKFIKENKSNIKKLINLRNSCCAHLDNIFLKEPFIINRTFIWKCKNFIKKLIATELSDFNKKTTQMQSRIDLILKNNIRNK